MGKVDGKVCFVKYALPEEEVVFKVENETSSYIKGVVSELLTASPDRVKPVCRYYGACGGCQYQHLAYGKEIIYKKMQLEDLMRRFGGLQDFSSDIVASEGPYHYRGNITLHKGDQGYGFYLPKSNSVISIEECAISSKEINKVLAELKKGEPEDQVTLKQDHKGKVWRSDLAGEKFFTDVYAGKAIVFSPRIFSQCNRYIALKMVEELNLWLSDIDKNAVFFDLYCGAGFFSFLVPEYPLKIGMDHERISIECAKKTVKNNNLKNYRFYQGDVARSFKGVFDANKGDKNILLVDPPRQGLNRHFIGWLKEIKDIEAVYYISCDPSKLARDIKYLCANGRWALKRFKIFDMFPRTYHMECLAEIKE